MDPFRTLDFGFPSWFTHSDQALDPSVPSLIGLRWKSQPGSQVHIVAGRGTRVVKDGEMRQAMTGQKAASHSSDQLSSKNMTGEMGNHISNDGKTQTCEGSATGVRCGIMCSGSPWISRVPPRMRISPVNVTDPCQTKWKIVSFEYITAELRTKERENLKLHHIRNPLRTSPEYRINYVYVAVISTYETVGFGILYNLTSQLMLSKLTTKIVVSVIHSEIKKPICKQTVINPVFYFKQTFGKVQL